MTRCCFTVKKSGNRRRMVIVVALIGVYYLGKHSSSLSLGPGEGEKRYIRHPIRNRTRTGYVVEPPKQQVENNYIYFSDLLDPGMLKKKQTNDDENIKQNKIKMVTAELTKQHVKAPQAIQNKATSQHNGGDHTAQNFKVDGTTNHPVKSTVSIPSTGNTDKANVVQAHEPESVVMTDERTPTTKPTVSQPISTEGSTIHNSETNTTPVHSENVDEADHNLRDLVNDKNLFGFIDKNDNADLQQHMNILRTQSYADILKYQTTRRTKSLSQTSDDLLDKLGYSKTKSDDQPLLRNLPDNRDPKYVAYALFNYKSDIYRIDWKNLVVK